LPVNVDPVAALFNPAWGLMALHSTLSTYQAVGFAAAGVYAWALLRGRRTEAADNGTRAHYNRLAVLIAMLLAAPTALIQPLAGDFLARRAHVAQPAKLAALEGQFETQRGAPLRIGGWPDPAAGVTRWAIEIPKGLSLLATHDPDGLVLGLEAFPRDQWPEARIVHPAFQVMVGAGFAMLGLALWFWWTWCRAWLAQRRGHRPPFPEREGGQGVRSTAAPSPEAPIVIGAHPGTDWSTRRLLLWALVLATPLGFLALEAGWIVTEAGRQPWVIYGVMRTRDAVTPAGEVGASLAGFAVLYAGLAMVLVVLLRRLARGDDGEAHSQDPRAPGTPPATHTQQDTNPAGAYA
jgi:cytochrome d ubiquinol oxidase subunit I